MLISSAQKINAHLEMGLKLVNLNWGLLITQLYKFCSRSLIEYRISWLM